MADHEQLERLKQGVAGWNAWRTISRTVNIDLRYADLNGADLNGADLNGADLNGANLNGAHLIRADLNDADLNGADLNGADLNDADLIRADLNGADLRYAHLNRADLNRADLNRADLSGADLNGANLNGANLNNAHLRYADLNGANLRYADLSGADLNGANLRYADLNGANLNGANLNGANLNGANLSNTQLTRTITWGTIFGNVDLRTVEGLETVRHDGPSTIGIDTIYRSQGHIPKIFLQKAGVPESFIDYIDALIGATKPIEYATCFISYSDKDRPFAERLYNDLQSKKVRCWYAPHSLKIGDRLRPMIDQAIHAHDKLLLVLSQHSTTSQWVEFEVERALTRERKEQRDIIFPIRIDQTIMSENTAWANHLKDTRHIGDFEQWEDEQQYQTAFTRLLSDLEKSTEAEQ